MSAVKVTEGILEDLKLDTLFRIRGISVLEFLSDDISVLEQREFLSRGLKLTQPAWHPMEEKVFTAEGLYDPILQMKLAESGKTVFLASVAITQLMAQLGMMVPATKASLSPVDGIFYYSQTYESLNEHGRLADECVKISSVFSQMTEHSVVFFDEAFTSTDALGAMELSLNVFRALSSRRIRGIYNTHIHELTNYIYEINSSGGAVLDSLTAVMGAEERRTYRIERRRGGDNSYAKTIARRYGITYEALMGKQ